MLSIYDPALSPPDGLRILSGISLVKTGFADALNIEIDKPLPKWIVDRLIDVELQRAILDLQRRLSVLVISSNASDLDRTVLRLSIVHEWRRIILRLPVAPYHVLEQAISLPDLRQTVQELLSSLSDVSLDQIIDV
jgi:phenylacetic acid degradation operon negative regulatory protein